MRCLNVKKIVAAIKVAAEYAATANFYGEGDPQWVSHKMDSIFKEPIWATQKRWSVSWMYPGDEDDEVVLEEKTKKEWVEVPPTHLIFDGEHPLSETLLRKEGVYSYYKVQVYGLFKPIYCLISNFSEKIPFLFGNEKKEEISNFIRGLAEILNCKLSEEEITEIAETAFVSYEKRLKELDEERKKEQEEKAVRDKLIEELYEVRNNLIDRLEGEFDTSNSTVLRIYKKVARAKAIYGSYKVPGNPTKYLEISKEQEEVVFEIPKAIAGKFIGKGGEKIKRFIAKARELGYKIKRIKFVPKDWSVKNSTVYGPENAFYYYVEAWLYEAEKLFKMLSDLESKETEELRELKEKKVPEQLKKVEEEILKFKEKGF